MKALLSLTLLAGLCAAPVAVAIGQSADDKRTEDKKAKPYKLGDTVDEKISLTDIDGKAHSFKDYRGKVVFVHFHSIKCPAMKPSEPKIIQMVKDYEGKDVVFLGINANQREIGKKPTSVAGPYEEIKKHVKAKKVNFPILADHGAKVADKFGGKTTPHCFVIDAKGVIQYVGALDDDPRGRKEKPVGHVKNAIDALLGGKKVETQTTRPYG